MPEMLFVENSLQQLVKAATYFTSYDLEICVGYASTTGALLLKPLFDAARNKRVIVGLNQTNKVAAYERLVDLGAEVYVYPTKAFSLFHPKIYFGGFDAQAWSMIGSSNLTDNGLFKSVERNVFMSGQRYDEPFLSIERNIQSFREEAYIFDNSIRNELTIIFRSMGEQKNEYEFVKRLSIAGIVPKSKANLSIPDESQRVAVDTFIAFVKTTRLEYGYQILLLLVILRNRDEIINIEAAALFFIRFYQQRQLKGLPVEKQYNGKNALVQDIDTVSIAKVRQMIKTSPFPRFESKGFLDLTDDGQSFILNQALLEGLTSEHKRELHGIATKRLANHFDQSETEIQELINAAIR